MDQKLILFLGLFHSCNFYGVEIRERADRLRISEEEAAERLEQEIAFQNLLELLGIDVNDSEEGAIERMTEASARLNITELFARDINDDD